MEDWNSAKLSSELEEKPLENIFTPEKIIS